MTTSREARMKRKLRVRKQIFGTPARPRLNVFRSARHIYAQVIEDTTGRTLVAASTMEPALRAQYGGNLDAARAVGRLVAERALEKGISQVVFDRGGFLYHGRVAAVADAAREVGLKF